MHFLLDSIRYLGVFGLLAARLASAFQGEEADFDTYAERLDVPTGNAVPVQSIYIIEFSQKHASHWPRKVHSSLLVRGQISPEAGSPADVQRHSAWIPCVVNFHLVVPHPRLRSLIGCPLCSV